MTSVQLPKSGLIKQDFKDKRWDGPMNQGLDAWEARIGVAGGTDPYGVAQGYYIGQTFYNTATGQLFYCASPGTASSTVWKQVAVIDSFNNFGNYISLPNGATIIPGHHQKVLGFEGNTGGSWTFQSGGFQGGWRAQIKCWANAGGAITIIAAPGNSLMTMGQRLTSLALTFPDQGELYTPDGVSFIWYGDRHFTSPAFALNAGSTYSYAHSLGVQPQRVILRLNCVVPDLNYVPGDVVHISTDTQASNYGSLVKGTPTNITAKLAVAGLQLIDMQAGITAPANLVNWTGNLRADVIN